MATDLDDRWGAEPPGWETMYVYPLLHPGLMRGVIARIGNAAGLDAIYWRGGVYVYETTTRSRALIEESITPDSWRGTVRLATKGGQGGELMARLAGWIGEENERLGLRPEVTGSAVGSYPSVGEGDGAMGRSTGNKTTWEGPTRPSILI